MKPICIRTEVIDVLPNSFTLVAIAQTETNEQRLVLKIESDTEIVPPATDDWALIGWLPTAMASGKDIFLEGELSARLFTQFDALQTALHLNHPPLKKIQLSAQKLKSTRRSEVKTRATGFSGGVDSYATLRRHTQPEFPAITHLANFNIGSFGRTHSPDVQRIYAHGVKRMKKYAKQNGQSWITVDSNFGEIDQPKTTFVKTITLKNVCAMSALNGFIDEYLVSSSGNPMNKISTEPTSGTVGPVNMEPITLPLLSTDQIQLIPALCEMTRIEKTKLISDWPETYKDLDVCITTESLRPIGNIKNCGKCNKCARTQLTLDALGVIDKYDQAFDVSYYRSVKKYLIENVVIAAAGGSENNRNLAELLKELGEYVPSMIEIRLRDGLRTIRVNALRLVGKKQKRAPVGRGIFG